MKPTFIGIGVQKCATTWLHRVLSEHPEVGMSPVKELNFFSHRFDHGYDWYERQFNDCVGRVIGEISPSYFYDAAVPQRVADYLPNMKVVVSFRDPVQRSMSNHRHEVRAGHFTGPDLSLEAGLANNPLYVHQGLYATHFRNWLAAFPRRQILVVLQEEIEKDPVTVAAEVYDFLGVDRSFRPQEPSKRYNRSFTNKSASLKRFKDSLFSLAQKPGFGWLWVASSKMGIKSLYRRFNVVESESVIPEPSEQTMQRLRLQFEPEVRDLSKLIGRSLDRWLP